MERRERTDINLKEREYKRKDIQQRLVLLEALLTSINTTDFFFFLVLNAVKLRKGGGRFLGIESVFALPISLTFYFVILIGFYLSVINHAVWN